jgi:hypothetical protein
LVTTFVPVAPLPTVAGALKVKVPLAWVELSDVPVVVTFGTARLIEWSH